MEASYSNAVEIKAFTEKYDNNDVENVVMVQVSSASKDEEEGDDGDIKVILFVNSKALTILAKILQTAKIVQKMFEHGMRIYIQWSKFV